jgi:pimeloyl-ACP methyl ester carboxylesterase
LSGVTPTFTERGQGFPIVFSHGMLMDRTMFAPQLEGLSDSYRVVAYDHRSRTGRGEELYDLDVLASDLCELLDELAIPECVLAGMSLGGFMGLRAALSHPARVRGLVVIGASAEPYPDVERATWERHFGAHSAEPVLDARFAVSEAEAHFSPRTRRLRPDLVTHWSGRFATRSGAQTWYETLAWARQDDIRHRLGDLKAPVLIVHGDQDEAVPLAAALKTHRRLHDSRLQVVPFAGHAVNLEQPEAVNAAIRMFVEELTVGEPIREGESSGVG